MRAPHRAAVRFCCCLFSHVAVAKNISLDRLSGTECEDREEEDRGSKKGGDDDDDDDDFRLFRSTERAGDGSRGTTYKYQLVSHLPSASGDLRARPNE